jgi:hypothetical protein
VSVCCELNDDWLTGWLAAVQILIGVLAAVVINLVCCDIYFCLRCLFLVACCLFLDAVWLVSTGERFSLVWFTPLGVNVPQDLFWIDQDTGFIN